MLALKTCVYFGRFGRLSSADTWQNRCVWLERFASTPSMADRPDNRPAQVLHEADLREKELKKKLAEFQPEAVDPNEDEAARLVRLEKRRASLPEDIAKKYEVEDKWVEEVHKEQFSAAGMKSKEDAWVESVERNYRCYVLSCLRRLVKHC